MNFEEVDQLDVGGGMKAIAFNTQKFNKYVFNTNMPYSF
jgi:hypothetical protein